MPVPTSSCDLCAERAAAGERPACAHHCLADAIECGPLDELAAKMAAKGKMASIFVP